MADTLRMTTGVRLACEYQQIHGCTPAFAAQRYCVNVSSVRRGLAKLGVAPRRAGRPVGKTTTK